MATTKNYGIRTCEYCGEAFEAMKPWQVCCTPEHRKARWAERRLKRVPEDAVALVIREENRVVLVREGQEIPIPAS